MTCRRGATGILDGASRALMEEEFGTSQEEEVITKILERGEIQESEVSLSFLALVFEEQYYASVCWIKADVWNNYIEPRTERYTERLQGSVHYPLN